MLNLFKKKEEGIKIIDKVVISEAAKLQAMLALWNAEKNTAFIFWFDESLRQAESFFAAQTIEPVTLLAVREAGHLQLEGKSVVFAEHYPLRSKEEELCKKINIGTVTVFSSLTEPLFKKFGADKIIVIMQKLGVKEDEVIEHKMISKAIRNAQEKIEAKIIVDQSAGSQEDWLQKNYVA